MMRTLLIALVLCTAAFQGVALAETPTDDAFSISVAAHETGKKVAVKYNHPAFGWVDAGYVDFRNDGRIILKIRGERVIEVKDLKRKLGGLSQSRVGDAEPGLRLAVRIKESVRRF